MKHYSMLCAYFYYVQLGLEHLVIENDDIIFSGKLESSVIDKACPCDNNTPWQFSVPGFLCNL